MVSSGMRVVGLALLATIFAPLQIVFASSRVTSGLTYDVWRMSADGFDQVNLTPGNTINDTGPSW